MMRQFLGLICLCAFVAFSPNAWACLATKGSDINPIYVDAFKKAAEKLGTPCLAHYQQDTPDDVLMEFLPEDQKLESWQNLMTVNLRQLDGDTAPHMGGITADFIKRIKADGGLVEPLLSHSHEMGEMYVLSYQTQMGVTDKTEYALAVIRPVGPDKAAILHWQRKSGPYQVSEIELFKSINGITEESKKKAAKKDTKKTTKKDGQKKAHKDVKANKRKEPANPPQTNITEEASPEAAAPSEKTAPVKTYNFKTRSNP